MKGTIYGNSLPSGTQVKYGWQPLLCYNRKTCASFGTICEVGLLVQKLPTLIFLTSVFGPFKFRSLVVGQKL